MLLRVPTTPIERNTAGASDLDLGRAASGGGPRDHPPRSAGSVPGPPILQAPDTGEASVGEDRQLNHGGLHQQTGRSSVHCSVKVSREPVVVGRRASVVSEGSSHSGTGEQGGRPHVKKRTSARQMEASPGGGESDLVLVRESRSGSV